MADHDDVFANGDNGVSVEFVESDPSPMKSQTPAAAANDAGEVDRLNKMIAALENQKSNLERENAESSTKIGELKDEAVVLRREKDAEAEKAESERKAAEAIAKRASQLEGEVVRLQHDLITVMNEGEESIRVIQELTTKIGELKEKATKEREEIDEMRREKKAAEDSVRELQVVLEELKEKEKAMEAKMEELLQKSAESERLIGGIAERVAEREREVIIEDDVDEKSSKLKVLKAQLPLIGAASAGAFVAAMAMCYIRHSKN